MSSIHRTTAKNPKRHGHQGNVKKYEVWSRVKCAEEREEMKKFGVTDADEWKLAHPCKLTANETTDLRLILERVGHEIQLIRYYKQGE
jgi:hypothetical protein